MTLKTLVVSAAAGFFKAPEIREQYFVDRAKHLAKYGAELDQMFNEPMICDDTLRVPLTQRLVWLVHNCETLIFKDDDGVVGIAIFCWKQKRRATEFIGWLAPEFRKASSLAEGRETGRKLREIIAGEGGILDYAWNKMRIVRMDTKCCLENQRAILFAARMGFSLVGICRLDFQVGGQLFDSVELECLNPAYVIEPLEEVTHGTRVGQTRSVSEPVRYQRAESVEPVHEQRQQYPEQGSGDDAAREHGIERSNGQLSEVSELRQLEEPEPAVQFN